METLRFLMVSSHYPPRHLGGDAVMVQYLSEELAKRGHEVHVLHDPAIYSLVRESSNSVQQKKGFGPAIHTVDSKESHTRVLLSLSFGLSGKARERLNGLCRELRIDCVHWHNTKGFIGRPYAFDGKPTLYTAHDYYLVCPRSNLARPDMSFCQKPFLCQSCLLRWKKPPQLWRIGSRRVIELEQAIRMIAPSEFMARRLRLDGLSGAHLLRNFVPDVAPTDSVGGDHIVYMGMLEPHKGPETLLNAFGRSRNLQGFKLHIIGDGSLREQLRRSVKDMGLTERVNVPGFLPRGDATAILGGSTAMVVPSEWPENAPLTVLESLSMGVPVISSDSGGLPEIIGPDCGSATFKSGNADELAQRIVTFWENRDHMMSARRKARLAYEHNFSPDAHIARYMGLIHG